MIILILGVSSCGKVREEIHSGEGAALEGEMGVHFSLSELLETSNEKPLIFYYAENIGKDNIVKAIYVFKDGLCRKYEMGWITCPSVYDYDTSNMTLGILSKMTDEEILEMLDNKYEEKYNEAFSGYSSRRKIYQPGFTDWTICLLTDSTGNRVEYEILMLPVSGIDDNPYTFQYDGDEYDVKERKKYFNTGYDTKTDVNNICDIFCFTGEIITGTVYNSNYIGFDSYRGDDCWSENGYYLFMRSDKAFITNLYMDTLSYQSAFIDPTDSDIRSIANRYYTYYYNQYDNLEK